MSKIKKILGFTATVVTALCFIYALAVLATQQAETAPKTTAATLQKAEPHIFTVDELLAEANKLRAEKGVPPLTLDPRLNESAQWKADDMAAFHYNAHTKPGETGHNGTQKIFELAGKECRYGSENLNSGSPGHNPFGKVTGWPSSKAHYEAIISPNLDTTGFGIAKDGDISIYVQHFCDL